MSCHIAAILVPFSCLACLFILGFSGIGAEICKCDGRKYRRYKRETEIP